MAIHAVADTAGVQRTSGSFLDPSGDFSFMFWMQFVARPGDHYRSFSILGDPNFTNPFVWTGAPIAGPTSDFRLEGYNGVVDVQSTTQGYIIDTIWYHMAVTYDHTTHTLSLYLNGVLFQAVTINLNAAGPFTQEYLGIDTDPTQYIDYAFCFYRSWAATLTATEIKAEMVSSTPVKATPFCATALTSPTDLADTSGNGRNWTAVGVLSTIPGPVLDIPLNNLSAPLAKDMGTLPATLAQDTRDSQAEEIWYAYTAQSGDYMIGFFGDGEGGSSFLPTVHVYTGDPSSPTLYPSASSFIAGLNVPVQVPVTPGTRYLLKFTPNDPTKNPAKIVVSGLKFPNSVAPIGSIGVPDDTTLFPLGILGATTAYPLQFLQGFPSSDHVDVLPDGTIGLIPNVDAGDQDFLIYDSAFNLKATVSAPFPGKALAYVRSDYSSRFYIAPQATNPATLRAYDTSGVLVGSWSIPNAMVLWAPDRTNSILYYTSNSSTNNTVHRFDLVNNVALSDLVGGVTGYIASGDMFVLGDGTIIHTYFKPPSSFDTFIRRHNPDGTLARDYQLGACMPNCYLALAIDDPNSFWANYVLHADGNNTLENFTNFKVSDGSTISTAKTQAFVAGSSQAESPIRVDPAFRFGYSYNTTFFIIRSALATVVRLTQLPIEAAYPYSVLQPNLNTAGLRWATPPPEIE